LVEMDVIRLIRTGDSKWSWFGERLISIASIGGGPYVHVG